MTLEEYKQAIDLLAFHWYIDPELPPLEIAKKILDISGKAVNAAMDQERTMRDGH